MPALLRAPGRAVLMPKDGGRSWHESGGGGRHCPGPREPRPGSPPEVLSTSPHVPSWPQGGGRSPELADFWIPTLALLQILIRPKGDGEP